MTDTTTTQPAASVDETLAALTLEEKASLTSGADFWTTKSAPGVPSIMLTDGPHGVLRPL
jgi:beta-glucosidase